MGRKNGGVMKKTSLIVMLLLILSIGWTFSANTKEITNPKCNAAYSKVTNEEKVCEALDIMKGSIADFSRNAILGENLTNKPVRIEFLELSTVKPQYANYDALGMKKKGQLFIYINQKHQNAPAEALASLLSHEALHQDEYNSIKEETYAWTMEATTWAALSRKNPQAKNDKTSSLVLRENMLLKKRNTNELIIQS